MVKLCLFKLMSLVCISALEVPTTYPSRSAFEVAAPGFSVEGFETAPSPASAASVSFSRFSITEVTNPSSDANVNRRVDYFSAGNYAVGFTWNGNGTLTFDFDSDIDAFAADILDFGTIAGATDLFVSAFTATGETELWSETAATGPHLEPTDRGNLQFFGVKGNTPFRRLVFSSNPASTNDLINFDEVAFRTAAIPEPAGITVMTAAAALLAVGIGVSRLGRAAFGCAPNAYRIGRGFAPEMRARRTLSIGYSTPGKKP